MATHWTTRLPLLFTALFAAAFVLALVQRESGSPFLKDLSFGKRPGGVQFIEKGEHYSGLIPKRYRGSLSAQLGVVLEDGKPLPLRESSITKVNEGFGRYRLTERNAHFAASDNSDPNANGRSYTLRLPRLVRDRVLWGLFAGFAVSLFFAIRSGSPQPPQASVEPTKWEILGAFAASLAAGVWSHFAYAQFTDGGLCVLGKPYSDAMGWHEFAVFLKEGLGFTSGYSDSRPFYAIFQAIVFLFAGDSIAVAQWTNVFLIAIAGTFIYLGARVAFSRRVALGVLAFFIIAPSHHRLAPTLLSELPALAFGAVGFYLLIRACRSRESVGRLFFLAGVFLALSNLARPYTLLALPLVGGVLAYLWRVRRWEWKRFTAVLGLYVGGILVVMAPWSIRQKVVNDTFSISLNSSELLYGAANPDGPGRWSDTQFEEAKAAGIDTNDKQALSRWFSKRLRETILEDPGRYLAFVTGKFVEYFRRLSLDDAAIRAVVVSLATLVVVSGCLAHRSVLPLGLWLLVIPIWKWAVTWPGWASIPLSAVVVWTLGGKRTHASVLTIVAFLVGSGVLSAMTGNFAFKRGLPIAHWIFVMLVAAAVCYVVGALVTLVAKHLLKRETPSQDGVLLGPWRGVPAGIVYGLCGFIVIGLVGIALRSAFADHSEKRLVTIPEASRAAAIDLVFGNNDAIDESLVYCEVGAINDYRWELDSNEATGHWSRLFERRTYHHTAAKLEIGVNHHRSAGKMALQFRGSIEALERNKPYVIVGILNIDEHANLGHEKYMVEVLAVIPWDEESHELQQREVISFAPTPEAEALLDAGFASWKNPRT